MQCSTQVWPVRGSHLGTAVRNISMASCGEFECRHFKAHLWIVSTQLWVSPLAMVWT